MVTEVVVDFLNPVDFMSEATTNERSHRVTTGELETLIFQNVRSTLPHDISLLLSACFQEWPHRDAVTVSVCVCVCVCESPAQGMDNNSDASTPRATQTLAQWKLSAWERRDGDSDERKRAKQIRAYVRGNSWIMLKLWVFIWKWLEGSRKSGLWAEGKYHGQEGLLVFPKPTALFWLFGDWKQQLELGVDLVTW